MSQKKQQHVYISIDQLQQDDVYEIETTLAPESFELQEQDGVKIIEPVIVVATAYLADDYLIVQYDVHAQIEIACALCNESFVLSVQLEGESHEEALEDIPRGIFDLTELVRETIFLEIPLFPQCGGTTCLNRHEIEKFISKNTSNDEQEVRYSPFENINIDI